MAVLVAVAQEVGAGAVSIVALKLSEPAVARRAGGGLVGAVSAVILTVTFPPDRNTPVEAGGTCERLTSFPLTNHEFIQFKKYLLTTQKCNKI